MYKQGAGDFKYFVGISSLSQIATRDDRVCVLNILGGESSDVTPVGHAYSGGNVVFGTSPGRRGQVLETPAGNVPVYNNVLEGIKEGHRFNCGVVYLPPSGARDGVAELIRVNPELKKIFIVTEKLAVRDSREIRAMGQANGIDIFGGNSLGVADAWNKVRIGGALGGDNPAEALRQGSIAILSNSGNFTTTIATYLRMAGWEIAALNRQIGAIPPRQAMKDASGASQMDPRTQVTSLYGVSMLDAAQFPLEANVSLALLHESGGANDKRLINVAIGANLNLHEHPALAAAQAARDAGNAPNSVLAAAASILGPRCQDKARKAAWMLIEKFSAAGLTDALDEDFDIAGIKLADAAALVTADPDVHAEAMLSGLRERGAKSVFVRYLQSLPGHPTADAMLAAVTTTLAWGPLMRKRISRLIAESLPWWMRLFGALIGASVPAEQHRADSFCGIPTSEILQRKPLSEVAFIALLGLQPKPADLFAFQVLVGLLLSNGPGTISAQGAKGAVSADGPEGPERVQLNKALTGFLTHTGYTHGGNGYEGIAFLIEQFRHSGLIDPGDPGHGIDLKALAMQYVENYARYKSDRKASGSLDIQKIPGVNHPVFKDKPVNHDPREVFIYKLFAERQEYNVFHEFYRVLVQALYDAGVSRNVYCVNIDAVIAALLLKMLWQPYCNGQYAGSALETAAFTIFLYPRMLGCAAEIDDHMNRGRNMDTRTPASQCRFVA